MNEEFPDLNVSRSTVYRVHLQNNKSLFRFKKSYSDIASKGYVSMNPNIVEIKNWKEYHLFNNCFQY